jgi:ArsR family transcriptional regulator, lead/cadmium/zinc/bismuth-responsive transcriptional repressor
MGERRSKAGTPPLGQPAPGQAQDDVVAGGAEGAEGGPVTGFTTLPEACPVRVLHPEAIGRAQATLRADADYADLAETFRALGDASRAKILHALQSGELCVCDLAALIGISESAISQHLRVLRSLRIVRHRKVGRVVYYSLEDACIRALLSIALTHLDDPAGGPGLGPPALEVVTLPPARPGRPRSRRRIPAHSVARDGRGAVSRPVAAQGRRD